MRLLVMVCVCLATARAQDPGFQPSAPYYATFFYPWYPQWTDGGHTPPLNWFSNYLPDPYPHIFDPAVELYSSTDDAILYWQLRKLAEARQEVAISSWWGVGHKTDAAVRHILLDVMDRQDNPYPNLRWAFTTRRSRWATRRSRSWCATSPISGRTMRGRALIFGSQDGR